MSIDYGFDTNDIKLDSLGLTPGIYKVMIKSEERKPTKSKLDGKTDDDLLLVTYQAVEGDMKGKTISQRYNIWNSNQTASNIAKQEIKRIANATGRPVSPEAPLRGRVLCIEVRNQKGSDQYVEIAKYYPEDYVAA